MLELKLKEIVLLEITLHNQICELCPTCFSLRISKEIQHV